VKPKIRNITGMKQYTVVLIYPDYAANQYGEEFWTTQVHADDVPSAQLQAQLEAMEANEYDTEDSDPNDWAPVFVCEGWVDNIAETE
jgi:hypothetical protein